MLEQIKRNYIVFNIYRKLIAILTDINPVFASKILFFVSQKHRLNLIHPKDFNEKLMWLKLNIYNNNSLVTQCCDKVGMRQYVIDKGCGELLPNLLGVWDKAEDIDWNKLPQKFVLKCNHGCGYNIISFNKELLNESLVKKQLEEWMSDDYYKYYAEINYKLIKKKILCEEFIETHKDRLPIDYKVYCFNGTPEAILVCENREQGHLKLTWFDLAWKPLDVGGELVSLAEKPKSFDSMICYSKILSKPFPFLRVDFYDSDGIPYLGELTFTPAAGIAQYYNKNGKRYFGELLDIEQLKYKVCKN